MTVTIIKGENKDVYEAEQEQTILELLRSRGEHGVHAPCGGSGACKKCKVYLMENGKERTVLSCVTKIQDGMVIRIPEGEKVAVQLKGNRTTDVVTEDKMTGYGIACDIGTTTVVCQLVDLATGDMVAVLGEGNQQRIYGDDVVSRIKASMDGLGKELAGTIQQQLREMIYELCQKQGIEVNAVSRMSIAANTTMCHLLAELDPAGLGIAPFTPAGYFGEWMDAKGLHLPFAGQVYLTPAVAGYVGGDITSDILAAELYDTEKMTLLIDVGTNGEIVLGAKGEFVCSSTAAGPAFEGTQISCGMTAANGAISKVEWKENQLFCKVIGDSEAIGICGSGLIDAVAVMLTIGAIDETGLMLVPGEDEIPPELAPYLFLDTEEMAAFRLGKEVYVSQADVRRLQLGKGAIAAGVKVLMQEQGVKTTQIEQLFLAGGFGTYISPESAGIIGLIPKELAGVTKAIGNAAVDGAKMALVSEQAREKLKEIQKSMKYIELAGLTAFSDAYMEEMMF